MQIVKWKLAVVALAGVLVAACAARTNDGAAVAEPALTACEDPRPQICTANYDPVCGRRDDGSDKTYANACAACAEPAVTGHRPGACE